MHTHSKFRKRPFIPLIVLAAVALFGFIVMSLWNALMPELFKLPVITYWQAIGLFILSRLLLGGFGGGRGGGRQIPHDRRKEMMHRMRERWEHMTPEQRERFRQVWKDKWDFDVEEMAPRQPEE